MPEKKRLAAAIRDARARRKGHITVPVEMLAAALGIDSPAAETPGTETPAPDSDKPASGGSPAGTARRAKRKPAEPSAPSDTAAK